MFIAGALAFPGYWLWDVAVVVGAVLIGGLIGSWLFRLFAPGVFSLIRWVKEPDVVTETPVKPGPPPQARYSDRR